MTIIEATKPQHLVALERANQVRAARAHIKRTIKAEPNRVRSRVVGAAVIRDLPVGAEGITAVEVLRCCRGVGPGRAHRWLLHLGIREHRRLDTMPERMRNELAAVLEQGS